MAINPITPGDTDARAKMNAAIAKANEVDSKASATSVSIAVDAERLARIAAVKQEQSARGVAVASEAAARTAAIAVLPMSAPIQHRPGDAPNLFGRSLVGGDASAIASLTAGLVASGDNGRVARVAGAGIVAPREMFAVEPARRYLATFAVQRRVNAIDPDNDAIRCALAWYDQGRSPLGGAPTTIVQNLLGITTGSGRLIVSTVVSRSAGDGIDIVSPALARYVRPYVETFGTQVQNDVEVIAWRDITDAAAYSPDLSAVEADVAALQSLDLGDRLTAAEAQITAPNIYRVKTLADLAVATDIPVSADTVEVLGAFGAAEGGQHLRRRVGSATDSTVEDADGVFWEVADDASHLAQFGVDETAGTDDLALVQAAIDKAAARGEREIGVRGRVLLSDAPDNPYGIRAVGGGALLVEQPGKEPRQINSYASAMGFAHNAMFLDRVMTRIKLGPAGGFGRLTIRADGDSRIEGFVSPPASLNGFFLIQNYLPRLFAQAGYPNVTVTNMGVSGTNFSDLDLAASLPDPTLDLAIIAYGPNDGALSVFPRETRRQTLKDTVRAKLAEIRSLAARQFLSILLIGPTPMSDDIEGRNEEWHEEVHPILLETATEFGIAYFDAYGFLRHCRGLEGIAYDEDADGQAIHPLEMTIARLWSGIFDAFFSPSLLAYWRTNAYTHTGLNFEAADVDAAPGVYDFGIHIKTAVQADGWPSSGQLVTVRSIDSLAYQQLFASDGKVYTRATPNGTTWGPWAGVVNAPTYENGWVDFGGGWGSTFTKTADGLVTVVGAMKSGTLTVDTTVLTLPAGFRPTGNFYFPVATGVGLGFGLGRVLATGQVQVAKDWSADMTCFSITFPAA